MRFLLDPEDNPGVPPDDLRTYETLLQFGPDPGEALIHRFPESYAPPVDDGPAPDSPRPLERTPSGCVVFPLLDLGDGHPPNLYLRIVEDDAE